MADGASGYCLICTNGPGGHQGHHGRGQGRRCAHEDRGPTGVAAEIKSYYWVYVVRGEGIYAAVEAAPPIANRGSRARRGPTGYGRPAGFPGFYVCGAAYRHRGTEAALRAQLGEAHTGG